MPSIELYAELLLNIRQVTLFTNLPSAANESTIIDLSTDRRYVSVLHDGAKAIVELPCPVVDTPKLKLPLPRVKELSLRFPVDEGHPVGIEGTDPRDESAIPSVPLLNPQTQIACRSCKNIIVNGSVSSWKDLPNESWAEMMDFWHCHKPHVPAADEVSSRVSTKGYSSSSALKPWPGVALVDSWHLLLDSSDYKGIKVRYNFYS